MSQQDLSIQNASDAEGETGDTQPSVTWKGFYNYAKSTLAALAKNIRVVNTLVNDVTDRSSESMLKSKLVNVHKWQTNIFRLEEHLSEVACTEIPPTQQLDEVNSELLNVSNDIGTLSIQIDELLEKFRNEASGRTLGFSNLREFANSPTVPLPTFHGVTTRYAGFKENFCFVIEQINGPVELWATHLVNSLAGPAKEYIGDPGKWYNRYDELWEFLDDKYANRWLLATETIMAFFYKKYPGEEPEQLKKYFYEQLDNLASIKKLGMSVEEVLVNFLISSLPPKERKELRDGLRVLQPGKNKAAFSAAQVRKIFNDTLGVAQEEAATKKGTLGYSTYPSKKSKSKGGQSTGTPNATNPTVAQAAPIQTPAPQPQQAQPPAQQQVSGNPQQYYQQYTPNQSYAPQGRGNGGVQRGGGYRGRGRGRGSNRRITPCYICLDGSKFEHSSFICPNFHTPEAKRAHLIATGRCPGCTNSAHSGTCPPHIQCLMHPGENHYAYLCGGHPHPGNQC